MRSSSVASARPQVLLYGLDTPHDPGFVANRPAPRQDWTILCFRTPVVIRTAHGLEGGEPGDVVVLDPAFDEWHATVPGAAEGFRNDWLHITTTGTADLVERYRIQPNVRIASGFGSFLAANLQVIGAEDRRRDIYWADRISLEVDTILLRIGRLQQMRDSHRSLSIVDRSRLAEMTRVRAAMLQDFGSDWSVAKLAEAAHMSPNRFSVLYSRFFDTSPIEELIQHRVTQSCRMLIHSGASLDSIAAACGFTDAQYFSRVFKHRMNCTPGAYRAGQLRVDTRPFS